MLGSKFPIKGATYWLADMYSWKKVPRYMKPVKMWHQAISLSQDKQILYIIKRWNMHNQNKTIQWFLKPMGLCTDTDSSVLQGH